MDRRLKRQGMFDNSILPSALSWWFMKFLRYYQLKVKQRQLVGLR